MTRVSQRPLAGGAQPAASIRSRFAASMFSRPRSLRERERVQGQHGGAAGQRLGYRLHQQQVVRASDDETSRAPVLVDQHLDVRQQFGGALDFVDNHAVRLRKQSARVLESLHPHVGRFQGDVEMVGEFRADQGGLSGLPGTGQRHHRIGCGRLAQRGCQVSCEHAMMLAEGAESVKLMMTSTI